MTEVPKIVHDRLGAGLRPRGASERVHPDADLLTAFSEQALPVAERDGVLQHLALCDDCREVVALALPDATMVENSVDANTETTPATVARTRVSALHGLSFGWPNLRWAALVAGVAVVAAVFLVRPGKPPVSNQQVASLSMPLAAAPSPTDQSAVFAKAAPTHSDSDTGDKKSNLTLSKKFKARQPAPLPQTESDMAFADNNQEHMSQVTSRPAAPSAKSSYNAKTSQGVNKNKNVGVYGLPDTVTVEPSNDDALVARNDAPIVDSQMMDTAPVEKAKPAPPDTEAAELKETQAAAPAASSQLQIRSMTSPMRATSSAGLNLASITTWKIKAGVLERSLDHGQSWQNALHADHPLLCSATHGMDVWAGGVAGTLFHSADGGATWLQIQPSFEARHVSADITHIDLTHDMHSDGAGSSQIVLSTSNDEIWSSLDGGNTWTKNTSEKK